MANQPLEPDWREQFQEALNNKQDEPDPEVETEAGADTSTGEYTQTEATAPTEEYTQAGADAPTDADVPTEAAAPTEEYTQTDTEAGSPAGTDTDEPLPNFYGRQYDHPDPVIPDGWDDTSAEDGSEQPSRFVAFLRRNWAELAIMFTVLAIMTAWSFTAPHYLPGGPDEPMRNLIVKWLYKHPGHLPLGDEKAIRSETWGLSYGYYPILSYMVSAFFMMVAGLFTESQIVLLHVARLADVMFLTIASGFVIKAGKKLFGRSQGLFFACLVIFLPGFHYMGTYINNESLALMACAIIFCSWAGAYKEGWLWKNVIMLGIGIGLCAMSYYSAYGWILWSFFFFIFSILADTSKPMGKRVGFMITRGLVVTVLTLGIAGWWFVRSYLLHDGDFLGIRSANATAEKYGAAGFKPSDHWNPSRDHWSLWRFFIYQNPGWPHNWLILSWISFIGTFGHFDIYMQEGLSKTYLAFMFIGLVSTLLMLNMYRLHARTKTITNEKHALGRTRTITIEIDKKFSQEGIFHLFMILAMLTPMALYFYYAYFSDIQAQGRYFICSVFPIMYFVACGFGILIRRIFRRSERMQDLTFGILGAVWLIGAVYNYFAIIIPAYL